MPMPSLFRNKSLFALLLFFTINLNAESCVEIKDGPYIFEEKSHRNAFWLCDNQLINDEISYQPGKRYNHYGHSILLAESSPKKSTQLNFQGDFKVAAVSDIHGQFGIFSALLKNNNVIDQDGNWNFNDGHLVITGDVFDRGDKVVESLWLIYQLDQQAKLAGGRVHMLLGNHEVMVLNGDLRYLNKKYLETSVLFERSYEQLFTKTTVLGDWLRSRPVLVKVNNMLFAHGGFHPDLAKNMMSLASINSTFTNSLVIQELSNPRTELANYLHKTNGPVWYRGYFKEKRATDKEVNQLLSHFDVEHIIVGHTTQKEIQTRYQGKVIAIDAGMKNGSYGEVLMVEGDNIYRGTLKGEKIKLFPLSPEQSENSEN